MLISGNSDRKTTPEIGVELLGNVTHLNFYGPNHISDKFSSEGRGQGHVIPFYRATHTCIARYMSPKRVSPSVWLAVAFVYRIEKTESISTR